MESWGPGRHYSSGRHTHESARGNGPRLLGFTGGLRPQFLIALVTVLGLITAGAVYGTIQARGPADAGAAPVASVSAPAGSAGAAEDGNQGNQELRAEPAEIGRASCRERVL